MNMSGRILTTARLAGLLYLIVAVCGGFAQIVRLSVIEAGDASATAQNILDAEWLFRLGFASDTVTFAADVALAVVFYLLFKPVNHTLALMQAFFRLAQAAALGINMLNQFFALLLLSGDDYLSSFDPGQVDSLALLFLEAHAYGYLIGLVFFGLATLVLGYLVLKSGAFPRLFGLLLMTVVPAGYLLDSYTSFLIDDKADVISVVLIAPAAIVEVSFVAWLLIRGGEVSAEPIAAGS
jgi:hypothetical protein